MMKRALLFSCCLAAPLAAQGPPADPPAALPPASAAPTAPAATVAPVGPPANAVAVCNDQSVILAPAAPSACATRGGVKVTLPAYRAVPAPEAVRPAPKGPTPATPSLVSDTPPSGATMRCRDGSWLSGAPAPGRCDANGGTAAILPVAPPVPPAPRPPR